MGDALDGNPAGANEKSTENNVSKIQKDKLPISKEPQPQSSATKNTNQTTALQLPPDKLYHFFASHKVRRLCILARFVIILLICSIQKIHSIHGSISEAIARAAKDWLEDVRGLCGFFDVRSESYLSNNEYWLLSHVYVFIIG